MTAGSDVTATLVSKRPFRLDLKVLSCYTDNSSFLHRTLYLAGELSQASLTQWVGIGYGLGIVPGPGKETTFTVLHHMYPDHTSNNSRKRVGR